MIEGNYCNYVKKIMGEAAAAISKAAMNIESDQINRAVQFITGCKGKIILTGVGKSGLIGRKISATLTSIGTPSVFLHPSEALHGDLGIANNLDIFITISNSGETREIVEILPYIKHRRIPIIAIVNNEKSTLANNAQVVLNIAVDKEACPYNIVPTNSTTVTLALGDAIALAVMKAKNIKPNDFALSHPAGRLGKRLCLRVCDIMHTEENNPTVFKEATWYDVIRTITDRGLGAVNIIDNAGHLIGIITDGDIRRIFQKAKLEEMDKLTAAMMMTPNPVSIMPEALAYDAMKVMENRESQISVLPVVDNHGLCIGMIRLHDIVRSGL